MRNIIKQYYLALFATFIYFGLKFFSPEILPDILNLSSINSTSFFELLISATTSIFGILIAVILLTVGFVKQTSFRWDKDNILTKPNVTNLVSIAISIIILSFISYLSITDFQNPNNLTIAYFLGFLFVSFIISIFPATQSILTAANTLQKTKDEIQRLTIEQFEEIQDRKDEKFISKDKNLTIVSIRQELINSVRESDYEAYTAIIEELNNKIIEILGDGNNRTEAEVVFDGTSFIWNAGNFEALRVGNYQYFETIWESIEELYEYAAKKKIELLNFQYLNFYLRDYIKFLTRNKLGDSLNKGANVLFNIFTQNLKSNCPPQEEINMLYYIFEKSGKRQNNSLSNIQWDIINEFITLITDIQSSAIEIVDKDLYDTCKRKFEFLIREINFNKFPELKIYQEASIIISIISYQTYIGFNANENKLFKDSQWTFQIDPSLIAELIKKKKFYVGKILQKISDFLIKSQRKQRLDDFFTLNYWGSIARHISPFYLTNKTAQKSMGFILDTFEKLKNEIEETQLPEQGQNYNAIKSQIESIKKYLERDNEGIKPPILQRINKLLQKFVEVKRAYDFDIKIVKWEDEEPKN